MGLFSPSHGRTELERRIARLEQVLAVDAIVQQRNGPSQIAEHYENCFGTYRRRHSSEGSLHLALNEGPQFDPSGFGGQVARLLSWWAGQPHAATLELGFGQGYNLAWLAERLPGTRLSGVDITPGHVRHVQAAMAERGLHNVDARQGDFHALPWPDASFDQVFSIEAFCYARDPRQALAEAMRVLRPGGSLVLIDGYLTRRPQDMAPDEARSALLAARGMAMEGIPVADELLQAAGELGLVLERRTVLDAQVMPDVKRHERMLGWFVHWPWLARRLLARMNPLVMRNILAGYLMGPAMERGIWSYQELVLRKPAAGHAAADTDTTERQALA